jgi:hypothetical protein
MEHSVIRLRPRNHQRAARIVIGNWGTLQSGDNGWIGHDEAPRIGWMRQQLDAATTGCGNNSMLAAPVRCNRVPNPANTGGIRQWQESSNFGLEEWADAAHKEMASHTA